MKWFWVLFLLLPISTFAQVSISEVAWMGSTESANHEWIELYNSGEAIDTTGWILNDGMNLNIELVGTIPAKSYVVLERTSDDSAKGDAFLIYTGALVNTGATLKLLRSDGTLVDQVSGGENWSAIGGDNVTKETAQYSAAGWVTALPTPGKINPEVGRAVTETTVQTPLSPAKSKSPVIRQGSGEAVKLELPDNTLKIKVEAQKLGYVNQEISFKAISSGIGKTLLDSLEYRWNFGDGNTSTLAETKHIFSYPGTYVVTVYGGFKRQEQVARHEITILPVEISLTTNSSGDVQINNDSPYEIDISGYRLVGAKEFAFPTYSVMLPSQTVTIPYQRIGETSQNLVALYDARDTMLVSLLPTSLQSNSYSNVLAAKHDVSEKDESDSVHPAANFSFKTIDSTTQAVAVEESDNSLEDLVEKPSVSQAASVIGSSDSSDSNQQLAYLGLVAVLVLAILALFAVPKRSEENHN